MLTLENSLFKQSMCFVIQLCLTLCDPMDCSSSVYRDSPGKTTEVGCHALLQEIFPTQRSNPGVLLCRWILYLLSHQETYFQRIHKTPNTCFKIYIFKLKETLIDSTFLILTWENHSQKRINNLTKAT